MHIRKAALSLFLAAGSAAAMVGQVKKVEGAVEAPFKVIGGGLKSAEGAVGRVARRSDAGLGYTYVLSSLANAPSGQPSHFSLSGASATLTYGYRPHLRGVFEFAGTHVNGVGNSGLSLTELTYMVGPRYVIRPMFHVRPYAQALFGGVHAAGSVYAAGTSQDTISLAPGAGFDYPLTPVLSVRGQADYLLTQLKNGGNNLQNNLRLGGALVLRFGGK